MSIGRIVETHIAGLYTDSVVGEIVYAKKTYTDAEYWNCAMVMGARINNEKVVGFYPDVESGDWPSEPHTYRENDDSLKTASMCSQRAYQKVMLHRVMPEWVSLDFVPKAHEYVIGQIYDLRVDNRGILGQYRLKSISGNRNKGALMVSGTFEKV